MYLGAWVHPLQQAHQLQSRRESSHLQLIDSGSRHYHLMPMPQRTILHKISRSCIAINDWHIHYQ